MTTDDNKKSQTMKLAKIFNYIGGTLIFFGITYMLFSNWFVLGTFLQIIIPMGLACGALLTAISLSGNANTEASSSVFYLLGAGLLPIGLATTIEAFHLQSRLLGNLLISGLCFAVFLLLQLKFPRKILLFLSIIFGSYFFYAVTSYFYVKNFWMTDLFNLQIFVLGVSYLVIGYFLSARNDDLTGPLYFFGDLMALWGSFHLGGLMDSRHTYMIWEFIAPLVLLLSFVLSIPLKSKSMAYLASIFLIIYIPTLTRQFGYIFGDLGWTVILTGTGVVLMLLGYLLVRREKKFPKE